MKHFNETHGMSNTSEYRSWIGMKQRCGNINNPKYPIYGGRNISVCKRWADSFEMFLLDMGKKPSDKCSIDRIDNNGNYEPKNCRWADIIEQQNNTSKNHFLTLNGETKTIAMWAAGLDISEDTIFARKKLGWTDEEALTLPLHKRKEKAKGVTKETKKNGKVRWKAYAYSNKKRIHLGCFDSEELALAERSKYESKSA